MTIDEMKIKVYDLSAVAQNLEQQKQKLIKEINDLNIKIEAMVGEKE